MSTSAYAKIERGETSPAWTTVRQIAAAYELTIAELAQMVVDET